MPEDQNAAQRPSTNDRRPRTPMWVKLFAFTGLGGAVAFVILHLTGNGMVGH